MKNQRSIILNEIEFNNLKSFRKLGRCQRKKIQRKINKHLKTTSIIFKKYTFVKGESLTRSDRRNLIKDKNFPEFQYIFTFNVNVFATEGTQLSYRWYQEVLEESDEAEIIDDSYYKILEGEDREFLIIVSPDEGTGYCCKVSDDQGHEKTVFFSLEGSEEEAPDDEDTWSEDEDPTDEDEEENEL